MSRMKRKAPAPQQRRILQTTTVRQAAPKLKVQRQTITRALSTGSTALPKKIQSLAAEQNNPHPLYLATFVSARQPHLAERKDNPYVQGYLSSNPYSLYVQILEDYCCFKHFSPESPKVYIYFYSLFSRKASYAFCVPNTIFHVLRLPTSPFPCNLESKETVLSRHLYRHLQGEKTCEHVFYNSIKLQKCNETWLYLQTFLPPEISSLVLDYVRTNLRLCLGDDPWEIEKPNIKVIMAELDDILKHYNNNIKSKSGSSEGEDWSEGEEEEEDWSEGEEEEEDSDTTFRTFFVHPK